MSGSIVLTLAGFVVAASLAAMTPGMDTALVLRTAATDGPRRAGFAALGIGFGCLCWASLVAVGLGALLAASHLAYTVLRWIGAAYLAWLGLNMLLRPRTAFVVEGEGQGRGSAASFARGALTNLLNPKVGVFYLSFLPLFVPRGVPTAPFILLLGAIHALLGVSWFTVLILATRPMTRWLRRPRALMALDRITGGAFVAFGVGLALEGPGG